MQLITAEAFTIPFQASIGLVIVDLVQTSIIKQSRDRFLLGKNLLWIQTPKKEQEQDKKVLSDPSGAAKSPR